MVAPIPIKFGFLISTHGVHCPHSGRLIAPYRYYTPSFFGWRWRWRHELPWRLRADQQHSVSSLNVVSPKGINSPVLGGTSKRSVDLRRHRPRSHGNADTNNSVVPLDWEKKPRPEGTGAKLSTSVRENPEENSRTMILRPNAPRQSNELPVVKSPRPRLGRIERTNSDVISIGITERKLHSTSVGI